MILSIMQELIKLMEHQLNRSPSGTQEEVGEEEEDGVPRLQLSFSPVNTTTQLSGPPISPQVYAQTAHDKEVLRAT